MNGMRCSGNERVIERKRTGNEVTNLYNMHSLICLFEATYDIESKIENRVNGVTMQMSPIPISVPIHLKTGDY